MDSSLKNLMAKVDKITVRLNYQEQLIKEKTEAIRNDINESLTKSQTRFDKR